MINKTIKTVLILIVSTSLNSVIAMHHIVSDISSGITINDPWIRLAPPNAPVLGLFMKINNNTTDEIKLLAANADGYQRVELHKTLFQHGIMKMLQQNFISIPAQSQVRLKPGSWHIMLIKPHNVPQIGEKVKISLKFDNNTTHIVNALVRKKHMSNPHKK